MNCPKCGHEFPDLDRSAAGFKRWKGTTKKQRSEYARMMLRARWEKKKEDK